MNPIYRLQLSETPQIDYLEDLNTLRVYIQRTYTEHATSHCEQGGACNFSREVNNCSALQVLKKFVESRVIYSDHTSRHPFLTSLPLRLGYSQ